MYKKEGFSCSNLVKRFLCSFIIFVSHALFADIGVHFNGAIIGSAGVVPLTNWNVLGASAYQSQILQDGNGSSTTATVTSPGGGAWSSGSANQILNGYLYDTAPTSITVANIPY